jgi:hypothetical protein
MIAHNCGVSIGLDEKIDGSATALKWRKNASGLSSGGVNRGQNASEVW